MRLGRTIAAAAALTLGSAPAAQAHHGYTGPVRLYLDTVRLEPAADGWVIRAALHDSGNGKPAPGYVVRVAGTGGGGAAFGPFTLTDSDADGGYDAALGSLPGGDWTLSIDVTDAPGASERAIPLKRTWPVSLRPGQPVDVLGKLPGPTDGSSSGSGSALPLALGVAAGLTGLGVAARRLLRRRSSPPVPAES